MFIYEKIGIKKFIRTCDVCGDKIETTYISKTNNCSAFTCGIKSLEKQYLNKTLGDMKIINIYKNAKTIIAESECRICGFKFKTRLNNMINNNFNNQSHNNCRKILYKEIENLPKLRNFYERWRNMHRRCYETNHKSYNVYAKIGICKEWHDFMNFFFDMYDSFDIEKQIDRITDKEYSKTNCRWVTSEVNCINRSSTKNCIAYNLKNKQITNFNKKSKISLRKFVEKELNGSSTSVYDRLNGKVKKQKPYKNYIFFNTIEELNNYLSVEAKFDI